MVNVISIFANLMEEAASKGFATRLTTCKHIPMPMLEVCLNDFESVLVDTFADDTRKQLAIARVIYTDGVFKILADTTNVSHLHGIPNYFLDCPHATLENFSEDADTQHNYCVNLEMEHLKEVFGWTLAQAEHIRFESENNKVVRVFMA